MRKVFTLIAFAALASAALSRTTAQAQGNASLPSQAEEHRAEATAPTHFDRTTIPLRDMVPTKAMPEQARGGRDFEPGRPAPVGNTNPSVIDPLAAKSVFQPSAVESPRASTTGTGVDPNYRVAPPDTTGDVGPNHYVQWVNLRYSVYNLTRGASNEITGFTLAGGFP